MKKRIKKIASQVLKADMHDNTLLNTCASWDSLHHLNLIIELEMEFGISFEPEEIVQMKSINVIEDIIKTKI